MSDFNAIFQDAAQRYQLDPALLKAQAQVESSMDPAAVNQDTGATGLMQIIPTTAKALGVDPADPRSSIYGAAALMRQNLDRYMGDVEKAVSAYHGGTDPANWGPKTQAYVGKVADAFGALKQNSGFITAPAAADQAQPDPIEAALTGKQAQASTAAQPADPIEAALMGQGGPSASAAATAPATPAASPAGPMGDLNTTQLAEPGLQRPGLTGDFLDAAAQHLAKIPVGVAQLAANAVLPSSAANKVNDAIGAEEKAYQQQVPDSPWSYAGATLGEVAPFVMTSLGRGLQASGDAVAAAPRWLASKIPGVGGAVAPTVGKLVSAGAQGAAVAGARPVDTPLTPGGFWDQKLGDVEQGAALGTAAQGAASLLGGAAGVIKPLVAPGSVVGDWARRVAGADAPQIAQQLRAAPELVPGSVPTTAQIWNSPDLALAEKTLVSSPATKGQWMARNAENNAARWDALNGVSGSPADLDAAVAAHQATVQPSIDAILRNGNPVNVQPVLSSLDQVINGSAGKDPVVAKGAASLKSSILDSIRTTPAGQDGISAGGPQLIDAGQLDAIRQNARKFLVDNASNGAVSSKQEAAIGPVKDAITAAIETANPGYRDYLRTFAQTRQPVTDMELAQGVVDTLGGRAVDVSGRPQITLPGLQSALRPAAKATYGFSPDAQSVVDGILQDLQRSTGGANAVRAGGSDTMTNAMLPGWLGQMLYGKGLGGGALNLPYLKPLGEFAGKRVQSALSDALLNPQTMAELLAPQNPGRLSPLAQALAARAPQLVAPFPLSQQLAAPRP